MTQIVTVSPPTAAYVAQGLKTHVRPGASSLFEQHIEVWSEKARRADDALVRNLVTVIQPPALVLAFITAARENPAVTVGEALRRYGENAAPPGRP